MGFGNVKINLGEILEKRGISRRELSRLAGLHIEQVDKYYDNQIKRLDISVLARICSVLECDACDIIEYVPPIT